MAILPVYALGSTLLFLRLEDGRAQMRADLMVAARLVAEDRERTIRRVRYVLQVVAAQQTALERGDPDCRSALDRVVRGNVANLVNLAVLDQSAQPICSARNRSNRNYAEDETWFRIVVGGAPLAIGRGRGEDGGATLLVAIPAGAAADPDAAPFRRHPARVVVGVIGLDQLMVDAPAEASPHYQFALLDATGAPLIATPFSRRFERSPAWFPDHPLAAKETRNAQTYVAARSRDDRYRGFALIPIAEGQLTSVLATRVESPALAWLIDVALAATVPLVICLAAFGSVWIGIDRQIMRWLSRLSRVASLYERGRYSVRASGFERAPRELQSFARELNEMAGAIEQRDRELRRSVAMNRAHVREVHHRVRNNLQIVLSLLRSRGRMSATEGERRALGEIESRVRAIGLVYGAMTNPENASTLSAVEIIRRIVEHDGPGERSVDVAFTASDDQPIDMDQAIPLALLVNEAVEMAGRLPGQGVFIVAEGNPLRVTIRFPGTHLDAATGGLPERLLEAFAGQLDASIEHGTANGSTVIDLTLQPARPSRDPLGDPSGG